VSVTRTPKGGWTIRVRPYPQQTLPPGTPKATAHALELDLKLRKKLGENYQPTDITLGTAIRDYIRLRESRLKPRTLEHLERNAAIWKPYYNHKLTMLRRADLEDFIYERGAYHPRSAQNELGFLKAVLRLAGDRGNSYPVSILGIPNIKHKPKIGQAVRVDAVQEIASWMPERSKRIPLVAFETGMRISELLNLLDADLALDNRRLYVRDSKTAAGVRTVHLNRTATALLKEQLVVRPPSGFVFPHASGNQWNRFAFTKEYIRARRRAGYPDLNFHQLRHSAVSHLAEGNLDLKHIAEQLGWSENTQVQAAMAARYRHLFDGELEARVRAMDDLQEANG
jgi:integrase